MPASLPRRGPAAPTNLPTATDPRRLYVFTLHPYPPQRGPTPLGPGPARRPGAAALLAHRRLGPDHDLHPHHPLGRRRQCSALGRHRRRPAPGCRRPGRRARRLGHARDAARGGHCRAARVAGRARRQHDRHPLRQLLLHSLSCPAVGRCAAHHPHRLADDAAPCLGRRRCHHRPVQRLAFCRRQRPGVYGLGPLSRPPDGRLGLLGVEPAWRLLWHSLDQLRRLVPRRGPDHARRPPPAAADYPACSSSTPSPGSCKASARPFSGTCWDPRWSVLWEWEPLLYCPFAVACAR